MSKSQNLISLKEASSISGYSADYIGQLIRSGKIPGKQVYCNIAWMTSAEAVLNYKKQNEEKNGKVGGGFKDYIGGQKRKIMMEFNIFKLAFSNIRSALPIALGLIVLIVLLNAFIIYSVMRSNSVPEISNKSETSLTF